jgi:Na+/H+ antiporter NhaD/arsenite permease-like protein
LRKSGPGRNKKSAAGDGLDRGDNRGGKPFEKIPRRFRNSSAALVRRPAFFLFVASFFSGTSAPMTSLHPEPSPLSMIPFGALLLTIALAPILLREHWHKHYARLCAAFAAVTVSYYVFVLRSGSRVLHAGFEYASFIVIVGAFFVVAAGIHLRIRGRATPAFNTIFLLAGALLATLLGTVGASMLLIRPWIALNRNRFAGHHAAFFIFIVSNIGGVLMPIGPPLLLGYVKGVPFWWAAQRCWPAWSVTLVAILVVFFLWDSLSYRVLPAVAPEPEPHPAATEKWQCIGASNFLVMAFMLACLVLLPAGWREAFIAIIATAAYWFTAPEIRRLNEFTFAPLKEIAWIFLGIFGTMIPVLDYMERHAGDLGLHSDAQFYWATGLLSAVLDNAPAYLTFLAGALGLHGLSIDSAADISQFVAAHDHSLIAISLGATCFGALTYIGNGPNLLVKAITEHGGVKTPSFFGYIFKFALPILLPIFLLVSFLFFR